MFGVELEFMYAIFAAVVVFGCCNYSLREGMCIFKAALDSFIFAFRDRKRKIL